MGRHSNQRIIMVQYKTLVNVINDYVLKCYPKENALKNFNRDDFKEEFYEEGAEGDYGMIDYDTGETVYMERPEGELYTAQEKAQKDVYRAMRKDKTAVWNNTSEFYMIQQAEERYQEDYFNLFQAFNNKDDEMLKECWDTLSEQNLIRMKDDDYHDGWETDYDNWEVQWWDMQWTPSLVSESTFLPLKDACDWLEKGIEKAPPVQENVKAFRWGRLPLDSNGEPIGVGGHGKFDSFTSTTYEKQIAFDENGYLQKSGWGNKDNRYNITVYVPKGTQGLVYGDSNDCYNFQNEVVLNRGQKFILLSRNDETKEAEILLY